MWKTGWVLIYSGGNTNLKATSPSRDWISNGLMYLGACLASLPNLITSFVGDTFRNTKSPAENDTSFLLGSAYYLLIAVFNLYWMLGTPSDVICTSSESNNCLSPTSQDWPCWTSNFIFCNWESLLLAALTLFKYTNRTINRGKMHSLITFNCNPWSINPYSSFIIDLLSALICTKLSADFLFKYWQLPSLYQDSKE